MALTKPPVLPAWAESGDRVTPSNAEIQVGWPLSSIPPSRQRFNWLLNYLANAVRYFSRRGLPDYDAAETYMTGDRIIGDDGKTYRSLIDNNTAQTPSTSPTKWERWALTLAEMYTSLTTPAQFDNSVKPATTAFVKSSGLQINNIRTLNGATQLAAADLGGEIVCNGTTYTVTLPITTGLGISAYGQLLILSNVATGNITVAANGTDEITCGINSLSSFVLQPGDRAFLILSSTGYWILVGGAPSLKFSGTFGASISGNGYKKGPAGEIEQWVYAATGTSVAGSMMVTLPIAFPSTFLSAVACSANGSSPATAVGIGGGSTLTQVQVYFAANTSGVFVRAIGK